MMRRAARLTVFLLLGSSCGDDSGVPPPPQADLFPWRLDRGIGPIRRDLVADPDLSGVCGEKPGVQLSPSCGAQATPCNKTLDSECDGLPGARDPWPTTCNRLVVAEELVVPPSSWGPGGIWSCGRLELGGQDSITFEEELGLTDATYLTEVRFTLGAVRDPRQWAVSLHTALVPETGQHRICELWLDPTYQPKPGLHSHLYALPQVSKCNGGAWSPATTNLPAEEGRTYILQSWSSGTTHRCRLFSATGALVSELSQTLCLPPTAGTIQVSTSGRGATIDYVRVFDH